MSAIEEKVVEELLRGAKGENLPRAVIAAIACIALSPNLEELMSANFLRLPISEAWDALTSAVGSTSLDAILLVTLITFLVVPRLNRAIVAILVKQVIEFAGAKVERLVGIRRSSPDIVAAEFGSQLPLLAKRRNRAETIIHRLVFTSEAVLLGAVGVVIPLQLAGVGDAKYVVLFYTVPAWFFFALLIAIRVLIRILEDVAPVREVLARLSVAKSGNQRTEQP